MRYVLDPCGWYRRVGPQFTRSVHSHHRDSEAAGCLDIMKITAASVQPGRIARHNLQCAVEVRGYRFVAPHLLGGHDQVEGHAEVAESFGQKVVIEMCLRIARVKT